MSTRVLVIGTHPDDIEIGCGGTIAMLSSQGYDIKFVVVTSGEEGCLSNKEMMKQKREQEARKSATLLGASEVIFLGAPDGLTSYSKEDKIRLIRLIRETRPEIVFIHSSYDLFPDHKIVHELSRSAILGASGPWYSEAGSSPHSVSKIFGYEVWNPTQNPQMTINISDFMEQKLKALECHESQTESVNYLGAIKGLAEYRGAMTMNGKYAESFEVIKLGDKL
jgi:LmbE family N-acetylglucosaminyl deacetylase